MVLLSSPKRNTVGGLSKIAQKMCNATMHESRLHLLTLYAADTPKAELKALERYYRQWFGERVETAREAIGLTVEDMMAGLGVSKNQVIKWRKGKNWGNPLVIARLARLLKKPFSYFIHPDFHSPAEHDTIGRFLDAYEEGQRALHHPQDLPAHDRSRHTSAA